MSRRRLFWILGPPVAALGGVLLYLAGATDGTRQIIFIIIGLAYLASVAILNRWFLRRFAEQDDNNGSSLNPP